MIGKNQVKRNNRNGAAARTAKTPTNSNLDAETTNRIKANVAAARAAADKLIDSDPGAPFTVTNEADIRFDKDSDWPAWCPDALWENQNVGGYAIGFSDTGLAREVSLLEALEWFVQAEQHAEGFIGSTWPLIRDAAEALQSCKGHHTHRIGDSLRSRLKRDRAAVAKR